jgi:ACR3 family arsenite efflux pump ArsB
MDLYFFAWICLCSCNQLVACRARYLFIVRQQLTLVLLFAFQGRAIVQPSLVIALLAVPILIRCFSTRRWLTG